MPQFPWHPIRVGSLSVFELLAVKVSWFPPPFNILYFFTCCFSPRDQTFTLWRNDEKMCWFSSIGGSKGGGRDGRPSGPNSFIFMQFSGTFWPNNRLTTPTLGVGAPSSGKSWIRHCLRFVNGESDSIRKLGRHGFSTEIVCPWFLRLGLKFSHSVWKQLTYSFCDPVAKRQFW